MTGKVILIIDDVAIMRKALNKILTSEGYIYFTAADAQDALQLLHRETVDLILMDIMMPTITGLDLCKYLKKTERYMHIPIIIITNICKKEDIEAAMQAGAVDYALKPIKEHSLIQKVESVLKSD